MAESSNQSDEQALMAFKAAIYVDSYNSFFDWSTNHTFCEWTGITCSSRRQHVVSLNLTGMGLLGPISPLLGNLSFFRVLDLSNNSLEGHIERLKIYNTNNRIDQAEEEEDNKF
ncbi:hypothetical protein SUGI_0376900 [Cryptomeria japonica]|nr:hypothetical protein SUGI_0376900 [Cryptomeria japonica]